MARHRLLQTTRMYVFEKLASSPDAPMTHRWHAEEILRILRDAEMARQAMPASQRVEDYRCVMEDARAAMKWAFSKDGMRSWARR
jgi:predicted ATPase